MGGSRMGERPSWFPAEREVPAWIGVIPVVVGALTIPATIAWGVLAGVAVISIGLIILAVVILTRPKL